MKNQNFGSVQEVRNLFVLRATSKDSNIAKLKATAKLADTELQQLSQQHFEQHPPPIGFVTIYVHHVVVPQKRKAQGTVTKLVNPTVDDTSTTTKSRISLVTEKPLEL